MRLLYYSGIILFIYWFYKKYRERIITYYIGLKYFPTIKNIYGKIFNKEDILKEFEKDLKYFKIDDYIETVRIYDINELIEFLNNFYNEEHFKFDFFYWILNQNNPINNLSKLPNNTWHYGIKVENKLIGTLIGRPCLISIDNKILKTLYSDYLCIHKKFRGKFGLAMKLQMKLCTDSVKYDYDTILYLVDNKKLYHRTLLYIKYYILNCKKFSKIYDYNEKDLEKDLKKYKILKPKNTLKAYKLYNSLVKDQKKIYQILSLEDFIQIFKPQKDISLCFISNDTFISIIINNFKYNDKIVKIPKLNIFLTKSFRPEIELSNIFYIMNLLNYPIIIINDTYYIDQIRWKEYLEYQGYSSLILFNYNIKDRLKSNEICFNFV